MKSLNFKLLFTLLCLAGGTGEFILNNRCFAMIKALNTAATGMAGQEENVNAISHNIANVNTTGFKKGRAEFDDLLYQTIEEPGARTGANAQHNVGIQIGSGVKLTAVRKEFSQGMPQITNNPFDLMINGEGFFAIVLSTGETLYTRDGAFNVNNQGMIVTARGHQLFPGITVPSNALSVNINNAGLVEAYFKDQIEPTNLGTIPLFRFTNPVGLKSEGGNLYRVTSASGPAMQSVAGEENTGIIQQGALETSNVNIMTEMTDLIKAQRAFEMNSKVMGVADQMLQTINNIR